MELHNTPPTHKKNIDKKYFLKHIRTWKSIDKDKIKMLWKNCYKDEIYLSVFGKKHFRNQLVLLV